MSTPSPMETPGNLNWDPASVDLPQIPMIAPGEDAMSMTIAGVLPTLTAPLAASVATLSAKETMFSGKLGVAESAYQNSDDSGGQSVGQLGQMLGQLGQLSQQAGAPAQALGGQAGMFGSMMQQAMQSAQGGGSQVASSPGSQGDGGPHPSASQGTSGVGAPQQQDPKDDSPAERDRVTDPDPAADGSPAHERNERAPFDAVTPGEGTHGEGVVPVAPPEPRRLDGEDLSRRM